MAPTVRESVIEEGHFLKEDIKLRAAYIEITKARSRLLIKAPFYGSLLMHLNFAFTACGTAETDMRNINWDPDFVSRLSAEEIEFVMQHEVLHCVLFHPVRAKGLIPHLYNVAADIVVNSIILKSIGRDEFLIDGEPVICHAPDGQPGYLFTAEEIYQMLYEKYRRMLEDIESICGKLHGNGQIVDRHDIWGKTQRDTMICAEWEQYIEEVSGKLGLLQEVPASVRPFIDLKGYKTRIPWKRLLHAYIQESFDQFDYHFQPADRRFTDSEFTLPGFSEVAGEKLEEIWFFVDASSSVDDDMFTAVFLESKACIEQFQSISGTVFFFNTRITGEQRFTTLEDMEHLQPIGKGGTSFHCIFDYLKQQTEEKPKVIVVLTDGYAAFPKEVDAMGVPVLWIIADEKRKAPWGKTIHISLK